MNYNVYEILSIIFFVFSALTAGCAVFYFLKFQIVQVIAVLTGRRAKKQIARWNEGMVVKENTTERLSKRDDTDITSVINRNEKVTSILNDVGEEVTSILYENQEEVTSILSGDGEETTSVLDIGSTDLATDVLEEKRMIHSAYIISLSGEPEPVRN